jgi:hypothetical protein
MVFGNTNHGMRINLGFDMNYIFWHFVLFDSLKHLQVKTPKAELQRICALFAWLISHQPAVLFSQKKSATSNQPTVLFSQNKPAPAVSHQPNEQTDSILLQLWATKNLCTMTMKPGDKKLSRWG